MTPIDRIAVDATPATAAATRRPSRETVARLLPRLVRRAMPARHGARAPPARLAKRRLAARPRACTRGRRRATPSTTMVDVHRGEGIGRRCRTRPSARYRAARARRVYGDIASVNVFAVPVRRTCSSSSATTGRLADRQRAVVPGLRLADGRVPVRPPLDASRARLSGCDRRARPRRRPDRVGPLRAGNARAGPADHPPHADLVGPPQPVLEGADPVPRAALPRPHVGRARQRALRPPDDPAAYTDEPFADDGLAVLDATDTPVRASSWGCRRAPAGPCCSPRSTPHRVDGAVFIAGSLPFTSPLGKARTGQDFHEERETYDGMGALQQARVAAGLRRLPRVLLRAVLHRAALHEADRGLHRLGPRDRSGDPHPDGR